MKKNIALPDSAVDVGAWEETNGQVCRYFSEADHPIPGVPSAYYAFTGLQLPDGTVADREIYLQIPHEPYSPAAVQSIIAALSGPSDQH